MRVVFMGTPDFAVTSLNRLATSDHEILLVVTQPDRPRGRGRKVNPPAVKEYALKKGLPVFQPRKIGCRDSLRMLQEAKPELIVVVAYGQILPEEVLKLPPQGCINLHASLLPKYRGAAPIQWAIINGEQITGVSTMFMERTLDTGDVIYQHVIPIEATDTAGTLHDKLKELGAELLVKTVNDIERGSFPRRKQDDAQATYARAITKEDARIDWTRPKAEVYNLIRGMSPVPGAFTSLSGERLKIYGADVQAVSKDVKQFPPGTVCEVAKGSGFFVTTETEPLLITEVQKQGSRRMMAKNFLAGYQLEVGTKLG